MCNCKSLQRKVSILEHKLDALEFYFSRMQQEDDAILTYDTNLENLLKKLNAYNQLLDTQFIDDNL